MKSRYSRRAFLSGSIASVAQFAVSAVPSSAQRAPASGSWEDIAAAAAKVAKQGARLEWSSAKLAGSTDRGTITLDGVNGLEIVGGNTHISLTGRATPFKFKNCNDLSLHDFSLSWQHQGYTQADVIDVAQQGRRIVFRIQPGFAMPTRETIGSFFSFDPKTRAPAKNSSEAGASVIARFEQREPGLFECEFTGHLALTSGSVLMMRLKSGAGPAFIFENCSNIRISRLRISAAPQMGIVTRHCRDVRIENVEIQPAPGSGHLLATGADGIHCLQSRGKLDIAGCVLEGLGDDGINVHDFYLKTQGWRGGDTLQLEPVSQFDVQRIKSSDYLPRVGDEIQIVDQVTLEVIGKAQVAAVDGAGAAPTLRLETSVSKAVTERATMICGVSAFPTVSISDCRIGRTRARGVLTHSRTQIRNCSFSEIAQAGVLVSLDAKIWGEGCTSESVLISGNTFRNCGIVRPGAIVVSGDGAKGATAVKGVGRDIGIDSNRFQDCASPILQVDGVEGLVIKGNRLTPTKANAVPSMVLKRTSALRLVGNRSTPVSDVALTAGAEPVTFERNSGLRRIGG